MDQDILADFLRQNGKHVFVNRNNPYLYPRTAGMERTEYGTQPGASLFGQLTDCNPYLSFWFEHRGERFEVHTHLIGNYNLENALAAICIATYFEIDGQAIARAISAYTPQNRRSQLQKGERNTLIIDAYIEHTKAGIFIFIDNLLHTAGDFHIFLWNGG